MFTGRTGLDDRQPEVYKEVMKRNEFKTLCRKKNQSNEKRKNGKLPEAFDLDDWDYSTIN